MQDAIAVHANGFLSLDPTGKLCMRRQDTAGRRSGPLDGAANSFGVPRLALERQQSPMAISIVRMQRLDRLKER
jgi:hypothetical protein